MTKAEKIMLERKFNSIYRFNFNAFENEFFFNLSTFLNLVKILGKRLLDSSQK